MLKQSSLHRCALAAGLVVVLALSATASLAQVPNLLNYQGQLTNSGGSPQNGTFTMGFSVFDAQAGGNQLPTATPWSETQMVTVTNGVFNVLLGSMTALPASLFTGGPSDASGPLRFLQIIVNGETLAPRRRIVSAAYAIQPTFSRTRVFCFDPSSQGMSATSALVTFPAATIDALGEFNNATDTFTATVAGIYFVNTFAAIGMPNNTLSNNYLELKKNGVTYAVSVNILGLGFGMTPMVGPNNVTTLVSLSAGDTITVFGSTSGGAGFISNKGLTIHRID